MPIAADAAITVEDEYSFRFRLRENLAISYVPFQDWSRCDHLTADFTKQELIRR